MVLCKAEQRKKWIIPAMLSAIHNADLYETCFDDYVTIQCVVQNILFCIHISNYDAICFHCWPNVMCTASSVLFRYFPFGGAGEDCDESSSVQGRPQPLWWCSDIADRSLPQSDAAVSPNYTFTITPFALYVYCQQNNDLLQVGDTRVSMINGGYACAHVQLRGCV